MKTFLVYSKKHLKFISSIEDISKLKFIKYGFNWLYFIDFLNILYSLKRNFLVIAALVIAVYFLFSGNAHLQTFFIITIAFFAYSMEGFFLRKRKYKIISTIEAKNAKQAKEIFLKEYILNERELLAKK